MESTSRNFSVKLGKQLKKTLKYEKKLKEVEAKMESLLSTNQNLLSAIEKLQVGTGNRA